MQALGQGVALPEGNLVARAPRNSPPVAELPPPQSASPVQEDGAAAVCGGDEVGGRRGARHSVAAAGISCRQQPDARPSRHPRHSASSTTIPLVFNTDEELASAPTDPPTMGEGILARIQGRSAHQRQPSKTRGSPRSWKPALPEQISSGSLQT